jgi:hypothetical protein
MRNIRFTSVWLVLVLASKAALGQDARSITTSPGTPAALTFLLNQTASCDIGPIGLPTVTEPPAHGSVQMRIALSNVPAMGTCPARQVPTIALLYVPESGFVGLDAVSIRIEMGDHSIENRYQIAIK